MSYSPHWPENHENALRLAMQEGCTFTQASVVLHDVFKASYTRSAVAGKAKRLGLKSMSRFAPRKPKASRPRKARSLSASATQIRTKPMPRTQQFKAEPVTGLRVAEVMPLHISLHDLTGSTCRWPYGDAAPYTFCGCEPFAGGPYCEPHQALSVGRGTRDERDADHLHRSVA